MPAGDGRDARALSEERPAIAPLSVHVDVLVVLQGHGPWPVSGEALRRAGVTWDKVLLPGGPRLEDWIVGRVVGTTSPSMLLALGALCARVVVFDLEAERPEDRAKAYIVREVPVQ